MRALTLTLSLLALPALPLPAWAQDLQQVYRDAKSYDAQFAAARYALQAGLEKLPQGRALILPTLGFTANTTNTRTDTEPLPEQIQGLEGRAEARNLVGILAAVTGVQPADVLREHGGKGFSEFKSLLAEALVAHLSPIRTEMARLLDDAPALDAALRLGAQRAAAIAEPIVTEAERIVGFLPR